MFSSVRERKRGEPMTEFDQLGVGSSSIDRRARAAIESWIEEYPAAHRSDMEARLRSDFHPAFFELFLFALFTRLGFEPQVHPQVSLEHERVPDFLMWRGHPRFYLEAAVVGEDDGQVALRRRLDKMTLALAEVLSGDFDLGLERADFAEDNFPRQAVIRSVQAWLDTLRVEEIDVRLMVSGERGEIATFTDGDLRLRVWAIPRQHEARGLRTPVRVTRVRSEATLVTCGDAIRRVIHRKKRRYGRLMLPYVIAINGLSDNCTVDDIQDAAFGSVSTHVFGPDAGELRTVTVRSDDGAISDSSSESSRRVSAVLAESNLSPWSMFDEDRITPVLVRNTDADLSLSAEQLPILCVADGHDGPQSLANRQFVPARKILGLDREVIL